MNTDTLKIRTVLSQQSLQALEARRTRIKKLRDQFYEAVTDSDMDTQKQVLTDARREGIELFNGSFPVEEVSAVTALAIIADRLGGIEELQRQVAAGTGLADLVERLQRMDIDRMLRSIQSLESSIHSLFNLVNVQAGSSASRIPPESPVHDVTGATLGSTQAIGDRLFEQLRLLAGPIPQFERDIERSLELMQRRRVIALLTCLWPLSPLEYNQRVDDVLSEVRLLTSQLQLSEHDELRKAHQAAESASTMWRRVVGSTDQSATVSFHHYESRYSGLSAKDVDDCYVRLKQTGNETTEKDDRILGRLREIYAGRASAVGNPDFVAFMCGMRSNPNRAGRVMHSVADEGELDAKVKAWWAEWGRLAQVSSADTVSSGKSSAFGNLRQQIEDYAVQVRKSNQQPNAVTKELIWGWLRRLAQSEEVITWLNEQQSKLGWSDPPSSASSVKTITALAAQLDDWIRLIPYEVCYLHERELVTFCNSLLWVVGDIRPATGEPSSSLVKSLEVLRTEISNRARIGHKHVEICR